MRRQNYQGARRVDERPHPDMWGDDEAMTYREAERLLMPHGPLTHRSLRTAAENGRLAFTEVNGRQFTTKAAVRSMMATRVRCRPEPQNAGPRTAGREAAATGGPPPAPVRREPRHEARTPQGMAFMEALRRGPPRLPGRT